MSIKLPPILSFLFPLIQITLLHVSIKILVIFRPVRYTKHKNYVLQLQCRPVWQAIMKAAQDSFPFTVLQGPRIDWHISSTHCRLCGNNFRIPLYVRSELVRVLLQSVEVRQSSVIVHYTSVFDAPDLYLTKCLFVWINCHDRFTMFIVEDLQTIIQHEGWLHITNTICLCLRWTSVFIFPVTRGCVVTCRGYKHTSVTISRVLSLSLSLSLSAQG